METVKVATPPEEAVTKVATDKAGIITIKVKIIFHHKTDI